MDSGRHAGEVPARFRERGPHEGLDGSSQSERLDPWPLSSEMPPLAAVTTAPACVRAHLGTVLASWRMNQRADELQLIVSELVANAVAASADKSGSPQYIEGQMPVIRVCLLSNWALLHVEVWDQAPGIPLLRNPADLEESGRGLALVSRLSTRWGWRPATGQPGKCVWAEIPLPGASASDSGPEPTEPQP